MNTGSYRASEMRNFQRTDAGNHDFICLIEQLDNDLRLRDGDEHSFYAQFNKIDMIKHVIVAYEHTEAVGCGAIKAFKIDTMEVKRMFVPVLKRGRGIASEILMHLEAWCKELEYKKCVLETGRRQQEAINLYLKNNYNLTPNFGQYAGKENSVCFEKIL